MIGGSDVDLGHEAGDVVFEERGAFVVGVHVDVHVFARWCACLSWAAAWALDDELW